MLKKRPLRKHKIPLHKHKIITFKRSDMKSTNTLSIWESISNFGKTLSVVISALVITAGFYACSSTSNMQDPFYASGITPQPLQEASPGTPDPRVGLEAGLFDAEKAAWNVKLLSDTQPPKEFIGFWNSDLAFKGNYVIQGNYHGILIWNISDPANPNIVAAYPCPASQNDVSVYGDLLFVSTEGLNSRLDCGTQGIDKRVSDMRMRGIRIFDISDIQNPKYITSVQTCRGSHTHSLLTPPDDPENIYVYVSGSATIRPEEELAGCSDALPSDTTYSSLFRIDIIKVPLDNPKAAKIVNSPQIFEGLTDPPEHGLAPAGLAEIKKARKEGAFIVEVFGESRVLRDRTVKNLLRQMVKQRGGKKITAADSAMLRRKLPAIAEQIMAERKASPFYDRGPTQCHDITLYPAIGLAGGACEGYGLLLDISDPANPVRIAAAADSNFSYWHSATFSNTGDKIIFTDEWGGGTGAKCRESDPYQWGADAIFTITEDNELVFQSYYKMPAPQTTTENCVAHNGSIIPVPGRDIMVQAWYQGGVSVFDFTDPENPVEIAFFDRGPIDSTQIQVGGSWSAYWYDGAIVSSEIARGLDILKLTPSPYLTKSELAAARTAQYVEDVNVLNVQDQPKYTWPTTFVLAHAYIDQIERLNGIDGAVAKKMRQRLLKAEQAPDNEQIEMLIALAEDVESLRENAVRKKKIDKLSQTLRELAKM